MKFKKDYLFEIKETREKPKLTMCIVSIISGLSECMLEETVYTMLFSTKTQTKIQNVPQGGEPLHSWVLRAFIVH